MKHIKHTPVPIKQYIRDQIVKNRKQTLGTSRSTDPTNYDISNDPYTTHTNIYMSHGTLTRLSNSDEHNRVTTVTDIIKAWTHRRTM